jgi:uncharacterized protein GlcG (DUF336 family)
MTDPGARASAVPGGISLAQASAVVDGTLAAGEAKGFAPLTVVVVDTGAHLVVAKRADGAGWLRVQVAEAKAAGALAMGWPAREHQARAERLPQFFAALTVLAGGRFLPVAGIKAAGLVPWLET